MAVNTTRSHGGGGIMLWGCITSEGPGYACQMYDGTMNSEVYQEILGTSLKDTLGYYGLDWKSSIFQHDNDPKYRSKSTKQYMEDNSMCYIDDRPSQSPDLNPIEHIWHHLKLKLSMYENRAKSMHELWQRVEKEWNSFTKDQCLKYIDSMPERIQDVIAEKGGSTRY
ncbi:hypothetical protein G6F46_011957 [Rhizopus delemar]|nr:hypothetical protein G6F46_011957 [Rhizopus delemar]